MKFIISKSFTFLPLVVVSLSVLVTASEVLSISRAMRYILDTKLETNITIIGRPIAFEIG